MPQLLEIADFDERRPQFERGFNDSDGVVNDTCQVVLEEIGFKAIECLLKNGSEHPQGIDPLLGLGILGHRQRPRVEVDDLSQNRFCVLSRNSARVLEGYAKFIARGHGGMDVSDRAYLRVLIRQLRKKLGDDSSNPTYIETDGFIGYRFRNAPN